MQMKINKHSASEDEELEAVIRDAYPKVYSYLYHRTLDAALSKDLTQETFYRFYKHQDQYEETGQLLNFLYRIALHLVYDHTRSRRYTDELQEEQVRDDTYNGERLFQKKEEFVILRSWISELPPHLQDVILLRYDEGLKQYVIIPEEAETVRWIFAMYLEGRSLREIAKALNGAGLTTVKGCEFAEGSLNVMIRNEIYAGDIGRNALWRTPLQRTK